MENVLWTQVLATSAINMGAMCTGVAIGWSRGAEKVVKNGAVNKIQTTEEQMTLVAAMFYLGAMTICIPTGFLINLTGRKLICLLAIIPFLLGWALMIFAVNIYMLYAGRFIIGLGGGIFCVAAPLYTSEISHTEVRGMLCSFYYMFVALGILYCFIIGNILPVKAYMYACSAPCILFFIAFVFQPESPEFWLRKGKEEKAIKSLAWFREVEYDTSNEIFEEKERLKMDKQKTCKETLKSKVTIKAVMVCFGLMFYQRFAGMNAVVFFAKEIFKESGTSMSFHSCSIIIGVIEVACALASALTIDFLGRKIYLVMSAILMSLSLLVLGLIFSLNNRKLVSESTMNSLGFLAVLSISLYIIGFSVGFGPIPWMAPIEMIPHKIKAQMTGILGSINWLLAFAVFFEYDAIQKKVGADVTFYVCMVIVLSSVFFVIFLVTETRGKTFEEIQEEINK